MLKVNLSRQSAKFLNRLPNKQGKQIATKIKELQNNPYPQHCKKLKGYSFYRRDIGE